MKSNAEYYNDLSELPIWNWWKLSETGNLDYLCRSGNADFKGVEVFERLKNEYIELFEVVDTSNYLLILYKKLINLKADFVIGAERNLLNEIKMTENEIKILEKTDLSTQKKTIEACMLELSKYIGFKLDAKTTSVVEYREVIRIAEKEAENVKRYGNKSD